jgi:hypothetical protein
MDLRGVSFPGDEWALRSRARRNAAEGLSWVAVHQFLRATKNGRQPQIIRSVAVAALVALPAVMPAHAGQLPESTRGNGVPCVSCLVIGIDGAELKSVPPLARGSLDGVQLLVTNDAPDATTIDLARGSANTGASIAVLISPPAVSRHIDEVVFDVRTRITQLRAAGSDLQAVIDADAFAAVGAPLDGVIPYVDAVVRAPDSAGPQDRTSATWVRLPRASNPSLEDLIRASLTSGGERILLPVAHPDWRILQEFSARRPAVVEVTGARRLTAGEIVARHQVQQRRQDAIVETTIATGTTTLLFEVPDFAAPITITAETTLFRSAEETNIEERGIRVNGASIAGGGATSPPELPLIEAERISTPPLLITLNDAYQYVLDGEAPVGDSRCYVVRFEPRVVGRGLARGRAWIDTESFNLRRLETVQQALRGPIVSSEEVDEFGPVIVDGMTVWLPTETRIFQSYEGAGFRTPIHRTIDVRHYEVNSPAFTARLAAAFASNNVMLRDTGDGLRYLVRNSETISRSTATRGSHAIRSVVGGVLIDPNISRPLPFAGLSYVNLDLFGRGAQLNAFFGGVFGQASWSVPAIAGTRWQAHGRVFVIGAQYNDRVFRNGREAHPENLRQQPASFSIGASRSLTSRLRVTADYALNATALEQTGTTAALFDLPSTVVDHGALLAIDGSRGGWTLRGWWNPVRRYRWRRWGLPGTFDPATRDYQRYGARITRTMALRPSVSSRLDMSWVDGRDLDRFSRYGFDAFENPLHGYPTSSIRYDRGAVIRSATAWTTHGVRVDAFADAAYVHDPGWASTARAYPGIGAGIESGGPFRTLLSLEWGYGFRAPRTDGGRGTQTARITVYRGF